MPPFARILAVLAMLAGCSSTHGLETDGGGRPDGGADGGAACPEGIDPWASPGTSCSIEGARCTGGTGDACGAFVACTCEDARWSCLVAEPDPVCSCGREPAAGDRCNDEGATCGECCPTWGGTGWAPMVCVEGRWEPGACDLGLCPSMPGVCPVDPVAARGTPCTSEGQSCGDGCCSTAAVCTAGVWVAGPDLECACDPSNTFACGEGTCRRNQACTSMCGPADGLEYTCTELGDGCAACDCATVPPGFVCQARGGTVFFETIGLCG